MSSVYLARGQGEMETSLSLQSRVIPSEDQGALGLRFAGSSGYLMGGRVPRKGRTPLLVCPKQTSYLQKIHVPGTSLFKLVLWLR